MSFRLYFHRVDKELLDAKCGTDDDSVHSAIDEYFERLTWRCERGDAEWTAGRNLAHHVIESGFPKRESNQESFCHRFAADSLASVFAIPGHCDDAEWRWSAFYDTLHTVPGFTDPIARYVDILDEGRPLFGSECPDEGYYGYLMTGEVAQVLAQCEKHKPDFEAHPDAQYCIGPLINLLRYGTVQDCALWFGFC